MIVAKSEQDIINHAEGRGSCNCGLQAFRQGRPVILCTPADKKEELLKLLLKALK